MTATTNPNLNQLSDYLRHVLMKSNKKCSGCDLICFEDEVTCPECHGYLFTPYTKHLENYSSEALITVEDHDAIELVNEIDLL